ncbi:MAG: hypothetical protein HOC79_05675 [Euryarchaeota archaeon]|jgi:hypothetical protein|nr:hypothetical protein [Euryarchaeota archaeon]
MGYRSVGAIWFSQQALNAITKEQNDLIKSDIENNSFTFVHTEHTDGIILEFESWKWYESYPDIAMYESMFNMLRGANIPYDFVRIGEDPTDVECREHMMFCINTDYEVI